jgi:hypothetical protein
MDCKNVQKVGSFPAILLTPPPAKAESSFSIHNSKLLSFLFFEKDQLVFTNGPSGFRLEPVPAKVGAGMTPTKPQKKKGGEFPQPPFNILF